MSVIPAIFCHALVILLALYSLKKTTKENESQNKKFHAQKQQKQVPQPNITKCGFILLAIKNFSFLNPFCSSVPNRSLLLLFVFSCLSSVVYFWHWKWMTLTISPICLIVTLISMRILHILENIQSKTEKKQIKNRNIAVSQIFSCFSCILTIAICLTLISQLKQTVQSSLLFDLILPLSINYFILQPLFCFLLAICYEPRQWLLSSLTLREGVGSNRLKNQFYRTNQSEANVNESLEVVNQIVHFEESQPSIAKQRLKESQGKQNKIGSQFTISLPTETFKSIDLTQTSFQKIIPKRILQEKQQPRYQANQSQSNKPTFFKNQNQSTTQPSIRTVSTRKKRQNKCNFETDRLVEIYADKQIKSQLRIKQQKKFLVNSAGKQQRHRSKPIVHQEPFRQKLQVEIGDFLSSSLGN